MMRYIAYLIVFGGWAEESALADCWALRPDGAPGGQNPVFILCIDLSVSNCPPQRSVRAVKVT
jgi:hypothetical protein